MGKSKRTRKQYDTFRAEYIELCKKHGLYFSPSRNLEEDWHDPMIIVPMGNPEETEETLKYINQAVTGDELDF